MRTPFPHPRWGDSWPAASGSSVSFLCSQADRSSAAQEGLGLPVTEQPSSLQKGTGPGTRTGAQARPGASWSSAARLLALCPGSAVWFLSSPGCSHERGKILFPSSLRAEGEEKERPHPRSSFTEPGGKTSENVGTTRHFLASSTWRKQDLVTARGCALLGAADGIHSGSSREILSSGCQMATSELSKTSRTCSSQRTGLKAMGRSYKREGF